MTASTRRPPVLHPESCKGCLRCAEACARGCLAPGSALDPASGLVPVAFDAAECNGCGLCVAACPEPWALVDGVVDDADAPARPLQPPVEVPASRAPLPPT